MVKDIDYSSIFLERPCSTRPIPSSARPSLLNTVCKSAIGAGMERSAPVTGIRTCGGLLGTTGGGRVLIGSSVAGISVAGIWVGVFTGVSGVLVGTSGVFVGGT